MIIVKASLKYQWEAEIKKFSDYKPLVVQTLAQLKKKEDLFKAQFKQGADLYILNYEALRDTKIKAAMHKVNPQFVAADEAVLIKDDTTKRAKALCEFANAKVKIAATATPVQKNPMDIFGLFKFIKPELFPRKGDFGERYVRWAQFGQYVRRPVGAKNEQELHNKIAPYMIVKTKEEISKQLPSLVVLQRYCEFTPKQKVQHERIMDQINELKEQEKKMSEAPDTPENRLAVNKIESQILMYQTFAQELADDETLLEMSESTFAHSFVTGNKSSKTDLALDLIKEIIDSGEKVTIFSRYARYQTILTDRIKSDPELKDVKIAYVNGSLNDKQRYEEVYTKFRDKDEYKILLMSDAGAEGLSLSWCQYIIELDLANSYALQTQRHGRIERADSSHDTVYVYQLMCEESFDEIAAKIVSKKEGFDSTIIKGN